MGRRFESPLRIGTLAHHTSPRSIAYRLRPKAWPSTRPLSSSPKPASQ
jgi:hypothetical protein